VAETIELPTPDGPMPVYEALPEGEAAGGILVLQDAFGVTSYLEDVCQRLAAVGWHALAPHLFHRTGSPVIPFDRIEDSRPHSAAMTGAGVLADVDACLVHWAAAGIGRDRVGVVGFCMGGTLAWFIALERHPAAAVTFYGHLRSTAWPGVTAALDSAAELDVPWLGLFGDADAMIPIDDVEELRAQLAGHATPAEIVRYPEANHAFHRDVTPDWYHEASAIDAWARTLAWFAAHIPAVAGAPSGGE
jgi:carboxymethylenebutenolidase